MKIADVLPELTILPLRRFADAWTVNSIKSDKRDVFEQAIIGEVHRIDSEEAVLQRLGRFEKDLDYVRRCNAELLLRYLLDEPTYSASDEVTLIKEVVDADATFHEYANQPTALRHLSNQAVEIYQSVLEVAWEDRVSSDEFQLIKRLQRKLGICRRDHRVIEIKTARLAPITPQDVQQALRDLTAFGFVCQFKLRGTNQVIVPEEIALRLRAILGPILQSGAYRLLVGGLSNAVLKEALEDAAQPSVSSRKDFLVERLIDGDVAPTAVLEKLSPEALDTLLTAVSDQKPPALKGVKIRHLIAHYEKFANKPTDAGPSSDPERAYYDYLVELATRQYDVLRTAGIIQNDQNVDRAFERGVRYAFATLLGHPAIEFIGNAHADGGVSATKGRMALWDCKSSLRPYALTEPKCAQFLQYVHREVPNVVSPFLVFSGEFTADSPPRALALKANCPPGTEVALMTAKDLKWLADRWNKEFPDKRLPLDVLAHSGELNGEILELRLKLFAGQALGREDKK